MSSGLVVIRLKIRSGNRGLECSADFEGLGFRA